MKFTLNAIFIFQPLKLKNISNAGFLSMTEGLFKNLLARKADDEGFIKFSSMFFDNPEDLKFHEGWLTVPKP